VKRILSLVAIALGSAGILSGGALAQNYPTRPITIVVPNTAGTNIDSTARIMAAQMSKGLGVAVVVENRPGGGQVVGYDHVVRQMPADGYTVLIASDSTTAIMPLTVKSLPFDVTKDFSWLIGLGRINVAIATSPKSPFKTWPEFVAYAKANPGKTFVSQASPINRLNWAYLQDTFGIKLEAVNYASSGEALTALLSGELHADWVTEPELMGMQDQLKALGIGNPTPRFPDVPVWSTLNAPDVAITTYMFGVRAGAPKAATDRLYAEASKALNDPEVKAALEKTFVAVLPPDAQTTEAQNKKFMTGVTKFSELAKKIGFQPQ
jgi:tripartite-type tricarboxylate transporter receptor subunit TctC